MWSEKYDAVVYLAAVSNDPMGKRFSNVTHEINGEYCLNVAVEAKKRGVKKFIFASSCSMYGIADNNFPNENWKGIFSGEKKKKDQNKCKGIDVMARHCQDITLPNSEY